MSDIAAFLKRTSEKFGFRREFFVEKNIPTLASNILVIPFYGDVRSTFVLSSFILKRIKETSSKYIILCSWPGFQHMFPYVDEFWSLEDKSAVKGLAQKANNFYNTAESGTVLTRNLIQHFDNVLTYDDLQKYYCHGFQSKFREEFGELRRYFPEIPASNATDLEKELTSRKGTKVVVFPVTRVRSWQNGECHYLEVHRDFWVYVLQRLIDSGYVPVVYQNQFTYDMSMDFTNRCIYLTEEDMSKVLCAMRSVGCVLDIHSGISRLAIAARCPFMCLDERIRFINEKEYEIDDLCCETIPKKYLFSLGGMLLTGTPDTWDSSFMNSFMSRLEELLSTLDRDEWMSTAELDEKVSYDLVRNRVAKRMGIQFISMNKDN